jgi:hypothetical protein
MSGTEIVERLEVPGHRIGDPYRPAGEISPLDGSVWLDHQSLVLYGRVALREDVAIEALAWGWHLIETMKCGRWLMERGRISWRFAARAAADKRRIEAIAVKPEETYQEWSQRQPICHPMTGVIANPGS